MTHAEFTPGQTDCPGNLTARYQLSRRSGQYTVYRCQQCQWTNAPYRRKRGRQTETPPTPEAPMRTLKLSLNRKAGAPNYGSDGVGMELQIEIPDDQGMSGIPEIALTYYAMLEHTINLQLERMSSRHGPARDEGRGTRDEHRPVAAARPSPLTPRPSSPTADDYDPEPADRQQPPAEAPRRNPGPPGRSSSNGRGKPKSGRELIGWANGQSKYDELLRLAKQANRGRIIEWDQDMVDWAYNDLSRPVGAGWGDGRN